jgi:hypothetical protein
MLQDDNPARRLFTILSEARGKHDNSKTRDVWAEVLGAPKEDGAELLRKIAALMTLYADTRRAIENAKGVDASLLLERFPNVEGAFYAFQLDSNWGNFKGRLDDTTMYSLRVCAHEMARFAPDPEVDRDAMKSLREEISSLRGTVRGSNLSQEMKDFVLRHLDEVIAALDDYRLTGLGGLMAAVERAAGALHLRRNALHELRSSPEGAAFVAVLKRAHSLVSDAMSKAKAAGKWLAGFLPDFSTHEQFPLLPGDTDATQPPNNIT